MSQLFLFNKEEKLQAVLNSGTSKSGCPFFNAKHVEQLNKNNTFEFEVPATHENASHVIEGNLVVFKDTDGDFQLFEITDIEEEHDEEKYKIVFCENSALELVDDPIVDLKPTAVSLNLALTQVLNGTRWQVGNVDDLGVNSIELNDTNVLSAIQQMIEVWGGEIKYRVAFSGNKITGRYIDIVAQRGTDTGKRFVVGKDLVSSRRKVLIDNLKTAMYGRGKSYEDENGNKRRVTFADVEWSIANGDPCDKPLGQEWIGDLNALDQFGRPNADGTKRHRFGFFNDTDESDPVVLLQKTWDELQKVNEPLVQYEANVIDLGQSRLGDTNAVIDRDFSPVLQVKTRIIEVTRYLDEPEKDEVVLGNFIEIYDDADKLRKIETRLGDSAGTWDDKYTAGQPIQTDWLEGNIDVLRNEIHSNNGFVYITDSDGILVLNKPKDQNPTQALKLEGGMFAIANSKNATTGEWQWRTFGTGDGFTADELNAGTIQASLVKILGDANFYWDDTNIHIIDPDDLNKQIRIGKYNGTDYGIGFTTDGGQTFSDALTFNGLKIGASTDFEEGYDPSVALQKANQAQTTADNAQKNIDEVENDIVYKIEIVSTNGMIFRNGNVDTTLTAKVYRGKDNITATIPATGFIWKKYDVNGIIDQTWTDTNVGVGNVITISKDDVEKKATFSCDVDIATA